MTGGGLHLEQYVNSLESLPAELRGNFNHMRELDSNVQNLMRTIDELSDEYLKFIRDLSPEKRSEQLSNIQKMFNRAKEYSEDKVDLAFQTYELVDKHIRRLDSDLSKFEAEIKEKTLNTKNEDDTSKSKKRKKKMPEKGTTKKKATKDETVTKKQKLKKGESLSIASVLPVLALATHSEVLDMPVDPNEPTYCLCHQVSYGEMIACDKTDCPIEWFHFACVSLTTKPKGRWYCPKCSTDKKKK